MKSKKAVKSSGEEFDEFLMKVANRLKKKRLEKGYSSYEQFAFDHNIGRAQYGKYERGSEDMRLSSLYRLLQHLDVSWEDFFRGIH